MARMAESLSRKDPTSGSAMMENARKASSLELIYMQSWDGPGPGEEARCRPMWAAGEGGVVWRSA